jgi:MFS family permease
MSAVPSSVLSPLAHPAFRGLWTGGTIYYVGNAMQVMAASWLMVELSGSSFLAALVQTAVFLPMFVLSLPAGVLADITDRRRLIVRSLAVQAVVVSLLAVLLLAGKAGPATLLGLTFVVGCCTALLTPAWNAAIGDTVPRDELPQAITALGISYNGARALGPALAGVVFAVAGAGWNFAIAALGTLAMLQAVRRHPPKPHPASRLPAERLWGGMVSALRYVRHNDVMLAQLVRTVAYSAAGSALWALLPIVGQQQLGLDAAGFGLLMGCLGGGAVGAGLVIGRLRVEYGIERLVGAGCVVYAAVMAVSALVRWPPAVYFALVMGGASWMTVMSTFNTATQTSSPPWVRARAVSMHMVCALGSFAICSAAWGALADIVGLAPTLLAASAAMLGGLVLVRFFPLRMGELREVTPASSFENLTLTWEPPPEAGPVAVEIAYRVAPQDTAAFLDALTLLRGPRKRDGATFWRVYRDLSDPTRLIERFTVESWAEYLHQRARATQADEALEADLRRYLVDGSQATTSHYLAER